MLNIGYSCSPVTIAQTDSLYGNCSSTVANIPLSHAETTWPWCVSQEVLWRWKLPMFSLSRFRKTPKPAGILRPPKNLENIGTCPKCRKSLLVAQPKVYTSVVHRTLSEEQEDPQSRGCGQERGDWSILSPPLWEVDSTFGQT